MRTIQQILNDLKAVQADMEDLAGKCRTEKDGAKAEGYKAVYEDKKQRFAELTTELEGAKQAAEMAKTIREAEELAKVGAPPTDLSKGADDDKGKSEEKDKGKGVEFSTDKAKAENELAELTMSFLSGKSISDVAHDAMAVPDSFSVRADKINPALTVMLPKRMVARILNPDGSKALLSTDSNNSNRTMPTNVLQAPDFRPQLLTQPIFDPMLYDMVRTIPAVNGKAAWPKLDQSAGKKFGGVAFTWKATEGADKAETTPVFTDFEITTSELSGWTELSLTMMSRSAIQLESLLTQLFQDAARYEFSRTIMLGTGTNQPLGIIKATNVQKKARDVAGAVSPKDLTRLIYSISKGLRGGGCFIMDDSVEQALNDLSDGMERPLFRSSLNDGPTDRLQGYRYYTHEFGPALGTLGDIMFAVPSMYAFAVEEQIAIARSDHAEFKKGRVVFRMICFVGGKPIYEDTCVTLNA